MIVVAGSTGVLGYEVCRGLRQRGQQVRALVRSTSSPERVSALRAAGCETVVGDLRDRASLDAACAGASVVMSTVTCVTTAKAGDSIEATDGAGNCSLVDAAAAAKAKQFIFVSFNSEGMPDCPLADAKKDVEDRIRKSGMSWTILHPGYFMESWLGPMLFADTAAGTARLYGTKDVRIPYVAVSDVAQVAVQCVDNVAAANRVIAFAGPEQLTQREALQRFEKAFGRAFTVTTVPEEALEAQWKAATDPVGRSFSALMLGVSRGVPTPGALDKELAVKMTTVDDFIRVVQGSVA